PCAATTPSGLAPTANVTVVPPPGSIRLTEWSRRSVTQTHRSSVATPVGAAPTPIVWTTSFVVGSILATVRSPLLATQTDPNPKATPAGAWPTRIRWTIL